MIPFWLIKARGILAGVGETRHYMTKEGMRLRKKVAPGKWQWVAMGRRELSPEDHYNRSVVGGGAAGIAAIDILDSKFGVSDFGAIRERARQDPTIIHNMYRSVVSGLTKLVGQGITKPEALQVIHGMGLAFADLRKLSPKKRRLMIKISNHEVKQGPRKGKVLTRYQYIKPNAHVFLPSQIMSSTMKLAGWQNMGEFPATASLRGMLKNGTATLVGKPTKRLPWTFNQESVMIPWRPESTGIEIEFRQMRPVNKRTKRVALLRVRVPYPFAREIIMRQVSSVRMQNKYLGELERSAPFKNYLSPM